MWSGITQATFQKKNDRFSQLLRRVTPIFNFVFKKDVILKAFNRMYYIHCLANEKKKSQMDWKRGLEFFDKCGRFDNYQSDFLD